MRFQSYDNLHHIPAAPLLLNFRLGVAQDVPYSLRRYPSDIFYEALAS